MMSIHAPNQLSDQARLRERVLWALAQERRPSGAYQLAQKLTSATGHPHHPNSIYRVLHALLGRGVVLQVASAKGWILRARYDDGATIVMVCRDCGCAEQIPAGAVEGDLDAIVATTRFKPSLYHFEVIGHCRACADRTPG
ncbi:Fur family transcriptional regulator [Sphingomonas sp.]